MRSNPQIEKRLLKDYQKALDANLYFKDFMEQHAPKKVDYGVELCFLPEFKKGEVYKFCDERDNFQPDRLYLSRKQSCATALSEISDENGNFIVSQENVTVFFERYLSLYHDLFHFWNYRAFHSFRHLFFLLVEWIAYYKMGPKTKAALRHFNPYNEDDIEDWLIEHDRLYYCNGILWGSFFEVIDEKAHIYRFRNNDFTVFLQGEEISDCIEFGEQFNFYRNKFFC